MGYVTAICGLAAALSVAGVHAAELHDRTAAAFDRYTAATEAQMDDAGRRFLHVDGLPDAQRRSALQAVERGEVVIDRKATLDRGKTIAVPDGLLHHWIGTVFVPGARLDQALVLMQDYDRHADIFKPAIVRSKLVSRDGDTYRVFLRFSMKKVITVVVNTDNEARFKRLARDRAESRIRSLRVAEVEAPGTAGEREKPVGNDGGFLWRLNTYWRFLERDGGTFIQCEAVSLSRGIPIGLGWLIGPFVTSIPRESLLFTLERTRKTLLGAVTVP
jgi:hypothetical protein